jgi:hypothetical protein
MKTNTKIKQQCEKTGSKKPKTGPAGPPAGPFTAPKS